MPTCKSCFVIVSIDEIMRNSGCPNCQTRLCRVCGCVEKHACADGCYWVEFDLCSTCHVMQVTVCTDEQAGYAVLMIGTPGAVDEIQAELPVTFYRFKEGCGIETRTCLHDSEDYETERWEKVSTNSISTLMQNESSFAMWAAPFSSVHAHLRQSA